MQTDTRHPIILWFRRDLRLEDHPALSWAAETGRPVIPVYIFDEVVDAYGRAPKWRLGLGVEHFAKSLEGAGSRLVLRKGHALGVLRRIARETGADTVIWSRAYDPDAVARDTEVKSGLKSDGIVAKSFAGHLLFDPWGVETKTGGFYKVYTPFWKAVQNAELDTPLAAVDALVPPASWPQSDGFCATNVGLGMQRGQGVVGHHVCVGAEKATSRLYDFLDRKINSYAAARDFPDLDGTSRLSENLTYGEISPRTVWHHAQDAFRQGADGAEKFLKELVWREFAYHLVYHTPHITSETWREDWRGFPWAGGNTDAALAWKQGRTGVEMVDAGLRELYVTGYMHNRVRMIVGSYLTKNLLTDWRVGLKWFEDCLIDWDPASNALGWQWIAGCGPDAAPYFRVFNPDTQAEKFDAEGRYRARFLPRLGGMHKDAQSFYDAVPKSWGLDPKTDANLPPSDLKAGRQRALDAYEAFKRQSA